MISVRQCSDLLSIDIAKCRATGSDERSHYSVVH